MGGVLDDTNSGINNALNTPAFNLGVGLLSAAGPSENPVSLGQALGRGVQFAQNAQQQQLRNQLVRQQLEGTTRQRQATDQLRGLLGETDPRLIPLLELPGGQTAIARGLAREAFPQTGQGSQEALRALQAIQARLGIEETLNERDTRAQERTEKKITQANSINTSIETLLEAGGAIDTLRGSNIETGVLGRDARIAGLRGALEVAGLRGDQAEVARLNNLITAAQSFDRLTTEEALNTAFSGQRGISGTDQSLRTLLRTKPSGTQTADSNAKAVAKLLKLTLRNADASGVDPALRQEAEGFISAAEAGGSRLPSRSRNPDIPLPPGSLQELSVRLGRAVTETDIKDTMRANKMTRKQVIDELNRRAGGG